jgi:hypothetical protein
MEMDVSSKHKKKQQKRDINTPALPPELHKLHLASIAGAWMFDEGSLALHLICHDKNGHYSQNFHERCCRYITTSNQEKCSARVVI